MIILYFVIQEEVNICLKPYLHISGCVQLLAEEKR